jgi:hypothetical protein
MTEPEQLELFDLEYRQIAEASSYHDGKTEIVEIIQPETDPTVVVEPAQPVSAAPEVTNKQRALFVDPAARTAEDAKKPMLAGKADPKANLPQGQARDEAASAFREDDPDELELLFPVSK